MNPITQTKNQNAMNERELRLGYTGTESSWHRQYKDSAWIFIGGLDYELTEGDVICVFSQYGEIANINLVRDKDTGRSKGFAFVCYENQKSTILATDNLNGIKVAGRVIRVDHVEKYRVPTVGLNRVGRQDDSQMPSRIGDGEFTSVRDYVREHGCGPEAMQKILELQKASNRTSEHSRSPPRKCSPTFPSGSRVNSNRNSNSEDRCRFSSASPPCSGQNYSPPRNRRRRDLSPPRSRRNYRDVSPRRHSRDRRFSDHSRRSIGHRFSPRR